MADRDLIVVDAKVATLDKQNTAADWPHATENFLWPVPRLTRARWEK